jgi:hypothetical protein
LIAVLLCSSIAEARCGTAHPGLINRPSGNRRPCTLHRTRVSTLPALLRTRPDQVRNKSAHIVIGVDMEGAKEVLGIWVQNSEGAKFWAGVCAELKNRGVKDIIIACCWGHLPPGAAGKGEG